MKFFRLLRPDEIECRVQSVKENGLSLLLYKTARTDADLLDETVGPDRWENDFKLVDGVLYGGIGVDYGANGHPIWKWDAGTESDTEAEKGRASDAFKRAGFKHGIGRELYSAPFVWVPANKCSITKNTKGKLVCYDTFTVKEIEYDDNQRISRLTIANAKTGAEAFSMRPGKFVPITAANETKPYPTIVCEGCGKEIQPTRNSKGQIQSVEGQVEFSQKSFGKNYCLACAQEAWSGKK